MSWKGRLLGLLLGIAGYWFLLILPRPHANDCVAAMCGEQLRSVEVAAPFMFVLGLVLLFFPRKRRRVATTPKRHRHERDYHYPDYDWGWNPGHSAGSGWGGDFGGGGGD